jgi:hypothetical protein
MMVGFVSDRPPQHHHERFQRIALAVFALAPLDFKN